MKAEQLTLFFISPDNTVVEAMQKIDRNARGILFVVNEQQKLLGVITDGDIRRWLIRTGELKAAVAKVMNINPKSITRKEQISTFYCEAFNQILIIKYFYLSLTHFFSMENPKKQVCIRIYVFIIL